MATTRSEAPSAASNDRAEGAVYPPTEPRVQSMLEVGQGHRLYFEECGRADGLPAVYLHGGPGSSCGPLHRRFFDPQRFRIVLYDQRGGGRSQPSGELRGNDTDALVEDLERLRTHLGIERWLLCGGSWGATLALLYAQRHPERVLGLVLRGTFLARPRDLDWYFGPGGAARVFPEAYEALWSAFSGSDLVEALQHQLAGGDPALRRRSALAVSAWESTLVSPTLPAGSADKPPDAEENVRRARIMLHYASNRFFLGPEGALQQPQELAGIPGEIIHGRCDMVCPAENAWTLHRAWPKSRLTVLRLSGHVSVEPEIAEALVAALNRLGREC